MVGVAEDDFGVHFVEVARGDGLDGGLGADGHVLGGLDDAVAGG